MKKYIASVIATVMICSMITPFGPVEARPKEKEKDIVPVLQKEVEIVEERTATSQVFQQEDGSYRMEISPEPIHVQDEKTEKWEKIDNTLTKKETGRFHNQKNDFDASFATVSESEEPLLSVNLEGKTIEIDRIEQNGQSLEAAKAEVEENKITYEDIYPNTDLTYTVGNSAVKEDIVLKEKPAADQLLEYSFQFELNGLNLAEEDGYFYLVDDRSKERVFAIEKPFMMDSAIPDGFVSNMELPMPEGAWSDQIGMEAVQNGNKLSITLKPDVEWLTSPDRVYPVTIDPTIKVYQPKNDLNDTTIRSALPDTTGGADTELGTGLHQSGSTSNIVRSLIQFDTGALPKGAKIMSAQLNMRLSSVWNNTASTIQLFEMSKAWEENRATWNRRTLSALWTNTGGDYIPAVLSHQTIGALDTSLPEPPLFKWPIKADIVQKWVDQPSQNIGLMLKAQNETLATYKKFYSGDASGSTGALKYSPKLSIVYYPVSRLGLESYWSYAEHELSDGQGYVNLGTGNLVLESTDFSVTGRGNSGFSFSRTYNSKAVEDSPIGYGWSFIGSESVSQFPNNDVIYQEGDGTVHLFTYDTATGKYIAPPGLYLTLTKANTDSFVLTDYNGNRIVFRDLIKDPEAPSRIYRIDYEEDRNL
ncbi:DNRLRE domain-containing protein, partial [Domibacillus mangrovi]